MRLHLVKTAPITKRNLCETYQVGITLVPGCYGLSLNQAGIIEMKLHAHCAAHTRTDTH